MRRLMHVWIIYLGLDLKHGIIENFTDLAFSCLPTPREVRFRVTQENGPRRALRSLWSNHILGSGRDTHCKIYKEFVLGIYGVCHEGIYNFSSFVCGRAIVSLPSSSPVVHTVGSFGLGVNNSHLKPTPNLPRRSI